MSSKQHTTVRKALHINPLVRFAKSSKLPVGMQNQADARVNASIQIQQTIMNLANNMTLPRVTFEKNDDDHVLFRSQLMLVDSTSKLHIPARLISY